MNFNGIDLDNMYANFYENAKGLGNSKQGEGQNEVQKMKNNPMTNKSGRSGGKGSKKAGGGKKASGASAKGGKSGGGSTAGSSSSTSSSGSSSSNKEVDKGGKYDTTKALLNKFKFRAQKNTEEEAKAEAEANRCDPCNEFKVGNGLDLGCVDWGKCAYFKPCVKKFPYPCSCMAYLCFGVTFVGGLLSSIILF